MSLQIGMADGGAHQEAFFQKQRSISAKVAAKVLSASQSLQLTGLSVCCHEFVYHTSPGR